MEHKCRRGSGPDDWTGRRPDDLIQRLFPAPQVGYTDEQHRLENRAGRRVFSSSGGLARSTRVPQESKSIFVSLLTPALNSLFTTLFPSNCRLCDAPLVTASRLPVCDTCLEEIHNIDGPVCEVCGERLQSHHLLDEAEGRGRCGLCREAQPPFEKAAAYGSYEGGLRDLIHLLKYERVRPAAGVLGRMLADVFAGLAAHFGDAEPLVIPVPLHAVKQRQRGFNQSELIARAMLKLIPHHLTLCTAALSRERATESQTGLTRHQRQRNMRGAFRVAAPGLVAGREVLLVDDVFTTGVTASECARVLRRAGAERVWVATVARVLKAEVTFVAPDEDMEEEPLSKAAWA